MTERISKAYNRGEALEEESSDGSLGDERERLLALSRIHYRNYKTASVTFEKKRRFQKTYLMIKTMIMKKGNNSSVVSPVAFTEGGYPDV